MRKEYTYHKPKDGIIAVVVTHSILLAVLLYFGLSVPLPLPAEEGILLNFGTSDAGYGQNEPPRTRQVQEAQPKAAAPQQQQTQNQSAQQNKQNALTQDYEEAPSLPTKKQEKKKEETKKTESPKPTPHTPKEEVKEVPKEKPKPERAVNRRALYPGKKENGTNGSEGITEGDGNQGNEQGEPDIANYQSGAKVGGGSGFSLSGRSLMGALPKPEYNNREEGIVVVEIKVDRNGNVISAEPGAKGSTTLDTYLCEVARKAALRAKFNTKSDAAFHQTGTITYVFDLQ